MITEENKFLGLEEIKNLIEKVYAAQQAGTMSILFMVILVLAYLLCWESLIRKKNLFISIYPSLHRMKNKK